MYNGMHNDSDMHHRRITAVRYSKAKQSTHCIAFVSFVRFSVYLFIFILRFLSFSIASVFLALVFVHVRYAAAKNILE